ncbi:hypothetical protein [Blastomonas sp.]|uniref:hypothetical protein n=1 Tax=Blastomonas sp. TaxID=1909299 RepID=UPI00258ECBC1|nr:hypothetical protein [Blastomonas sp.]
MAKAASDQSQYVAYFSCKEDEEGKINVFHVCNDHDSASKWCEEHPTSKKKNATSSDTQSVVMNNKEEGSTELESNQKIENITSSDPHSSAAVSNVVTQEQAIESFSYHLQNLLKSLKSFYDLIDINVIVKIAFPNMLISNDINVFRKTLPIVSEKDGYKIYGVPDNSTSQLNYQLKRLEHTKDGLSSISANVIMGMVARFDANVSALVRFLLTNRKERLGSSDRTIAVRDILAAKSFDDLIADLVDDEVHSLMRGSHEDQVRYIEQNFSIKIIEGFSRWGEFIEIFERRNLAAHGEGIVNSRYVKICQKAKSPASSTLELGSKVVMSDTYLRNSTDLLIEFGVLLIWWLWLKHSPSDLDLAYEEINSVTYELICEKRYKLSSNILRSALSRKSDGSQERTRRMMVVNLANCLKKIGQEKDSKTALAMFDWSAAADEYKICVASIQGDIDKVCSLMPKIKDTDSVGKAAIREWPAFDWVRDDERVKERFKEIFGEPLYAVTNTPEDELQSK